MDPVPQAENAATNPASAQTPEVTPAPPAATPATASNPPPPPLSSSDDVDAFLFDGKTPEAAAKEPEATPPAATTEQPPVTDPAQPLEKLAGSPPQAAPAEAAPKPPTDPADNIPDAKKILPHRISPKQFSEAEQEAIAYRYALKKEHGEEISLKEAIEIVEGKHRQANEAAAQQAQANPPPPDPVDLLTGEVAEIEAKIDEFEDGSLLTTEYRQLQKDLAKKSAALETAKFRKEQAQQAQTASFESVREQSRQRAVQEYPDAAVQGSLLNNALIAEIEARKDASHPRHQSLFEPNVHETLTREVAQELAGTIAARFGLSAEQALSSLQGKPAVQPAAPAKAPAPLQQPSVAAPRPAAEMNLTVAPGSQPTTPAAPTLTAQQLLQQSRTDPRFDRDSVLFPGDSSGLLLVR